MKRRIIAIAAMAAVMSICLSLRAEALIVSEPFTKYANGDNLIAIGTGGEGWGGKWSQSSGSANFWYSSTYKGSYYCDSATDYVYRNFQEAIYDVDSVTFKLMTQYASAGSTYGKFFTGDGSNHAIRIGLEFDTGDNYKVVGYSAAGNTDLKTGILKESWCTVTVENIRFGSTDKYDVTVDSTKTFDIGFYNTSVDYLSRAGIYGSDGDLQTTKIDTITITGVPEPSAIALFATGIFGLAFGWLRRGKKG